MEGRAWVMEIGGEVGGWPVDRGGWRLEVQGGFLEEVGFDMDTKKEMDFPGRICHRLGKERIFLAETRLGGQEHHQAGWAWRLWNS